MSAKRPKKDGICPACQTIKPKRCLDCGRCLVCALERQKAEVGAACCKKCEEFYPRSNT